MIKIQWLASIWCQNDQSNAKLQTRSNYDEFASIWRPNDLKCWVTSQNIQNKAKLQKWSKYNDLHRFDVKTIKATQNSKRDQITMNLHRFDVQTIKNVELRRKPFKTAKLQKWSKYNDLHRFDVKNIKTTLNYESDQIGRQNEQKCWVTSQNIQNNAKLQKWSNYDELHAFDIKTNKNVALGRKPFKTTQNYKSDQNTMTCIDLMSKVIK